MSAELDIIAAEDLAKVLHCKVSTINERARTGDLPGILFGDGGWVFPVGALSARLDEIALAESARRRLPKAASAVLTTVPARKTKRPRPVLPPLPPSP